MGEIKSSIVLDLQGNLERQAERDANALGRLGARGSRSLQILDRSTTALGHGLDRLGNRYTALLTGAAGLGTLKMVGDESARMTQLGVDAGVSAERMEQLRNKIYEVARSPDIRLDFGDLTSAVEQTIKDTGDLEYIEKNLRNIGLVMRATAADGKDVGGVVTEMQKINRLAPPEEFMKAMDTFIVQGKMGAVAAKELAGVGPRSFAAYRSLRKDADLVTFTREVGGVLQAFKGGTGNVEQAATSLEAFMRTLSDKTRLKGFEKAGIQIFDPEKLKKQQYELRPIQNIITDILDKTKGNPILLSELLPDAEAARGLKVTNLRENLKKYNEVQADGSTTTADAVRNAKEFNAVMTSLNTAWKDVVTRNSAGPIGFIAEELGSLKPETVDTWIKVGGALVAVAGAAVAARAITKLGSGIMNIFGKGGAGEKLAGGGKFGDAIPVYVVNGPSSIWQGAPDAPAGGKPGGKLGKLAKVGKVVGQVSGVAGAGVVGYEVGSLANDVAGIVASKLSGGKYNGEGWLGSMIYDVTHGSDSKPVVHGPSHKGAADGSLPRQLADNRSKGEGRAPILPISPIAQIQPPEHPESAALPRQLSTAAAKQGADTTPRPAPLSLPRQLARTPVKSGQIQGKTPAATPAPVEVGGTLKIEIATQPGTRATVRDMRSTNLDLDVDSGRAMGGHS